MVNLGIYSLLITIIIILVIETYKTRNWLSIKNIILASSIFLFIIPLFFNDTEWKNDQGFLFIIFLFFLGFLISIFVINTTKLRYIYNHSSFKLNKKWIRILTALVIIYYVYQLQLLEIRSINDFINYLTYDRIEIYLSNPLIQRSLFIKPMFETILYILIFYYWKNNNYKMGYFLWGLIFVFTLLTSHTRFIILAIGFLPFFYNHYYIKRFNTKSVLFILLVSVLFISVGNFARGGILNPDTFKEAISFETVIEQFNKASSGSTDNFYEFYEYGIEIEYLKQYIYYLTITFVPRAVWDDKPIVSYFWRVTKELTGNYPAGTLNPVLTTTIVGESYHQAGIIGSLLTMLVYTFILLTTIKILNKFANTELIILLTIMRIPMDMRGGLSSFFMSQITKLYPIIILLLIGFYIKNNKKNMNIDKISIY